ncbi:uncharacterized protein LOC112342936 [Selaginella moellendorffii]|uniref:uncharacterized protein LOC112342936 n=1 Tax=Selaginella moellendorffii TaxID=88036 RepID=UPI000D1CAEB8|nr:uncharacterized protein LOC112342936 [Selaginella moellendorffii]|eukprot:XP_024521357.1 uncharacterized protein LOC112342936 [Selaginella moellendorffii]
MPKGERSGERAKEERGRRKEELGEEDYCQANGDHGCLGVRASPRSWRNSSMAFIAGSISSRPLAGLELETKNLSSSSARQRGRRSSLVVVAGSKEGSSGIFAPLVVVARSVLGAKQFNQLRGKGIALHSQVITEFCKSVGADNKVRQGLIRIAKKNGEKLGFLA